MHLREEVQLAFPHLLRDGDQELPQVMEEILHLARVEVAAAIEIGDLEEEAQPLDARPAAAPAERAAEVAEADEAAILRVEDAEDRLSDGGRQWRG